MEGSFDLALETAKRTKSKVDVVNLLKLMRLNRVRNSRIVMEFGVMALNKFGRGLGDERFTIHEMVFIAALDTGDDAVANESLAELMVQFKDSSRVKRLVGMQSESKRQYGAASQVYEELLLQNTANSLAMKRKVAILKGQGKIKAAIQELCSYTEQFQADATVL
jgi:hypothetical protein